MFRTSKLFVFLINFFFWRRLFNHLFVVNTIFFLWLWLLSLVCDCIIWYFTKVSWRQDSRAIWWLSIRGVWRRCQQPRLSHLESLCYFFIIIIILLLFCNWPFHASPFLHTLNTNMANSMFIVRYWRLYSRFSLHNNSPDPKKMIFKEILEL